MKWILTCLGVDAMIDSCWKILSYIMIFFLKRERKEYRTESYERQATGQLCLLMVSGHGHLDVFE